MKSIKSIILLSAMTLSTNALSESSDKYDAIGQSLKATYPNAQYEMISDSTVPGVFAVYIPSEAGTRIVYWHNDTQTMIFGEMLDKNGNSITMAEMDAYNSKAMKSIDTSHAIKIGNGKNIVIEFLDTECPYCVRYNEFIKTKNDVTRYIFLHNAMGKDHPNSDAQSIHVLCSKNKLQALEDVYNHHVRQDKLLTCDEGAAQLSEHSKVARQYKVSGTPTMMVNGTLLTGFRKTQLETLIN